MSNLATPPSAPLARRLVGRAMDAAGVAAFVLGGRRPFARGYARYRWRCLSRTLGDPALMAAFRDGAPLPHGFGQRLDERVVEYPWLFSRLPAGPGRLLDAGSILNYAPILQQPALTAKRLTITTLAPEAECHWRRGISYLFADLRDLPLADGYFDWVACLSTLEHVGMDNTLLYTADRQFAQRQTQTYLDAVRQLRRVLKPGGVCYLSVPFGQYQNDAFQQQFDADMVRKVIETFAPTRVEETYCRYQAAGWDVATAADCRDCRYFNIYRTRYRDPNSTAGYDPDFAAAARAVAMVAMVK